jgi:hypothetical protein
MKKRGEKGIMKKQSLTRRDVIIIAVFGVILILASSHFLAVTPAQVAITSTSWVSSNTLQIDYVATNLVSGSTYHVRLKDQSGNVRCLGTDVTAANPNGVLNMEFKATIWPTVPYGETWELEICNEGYSILSSIHFTISETSPTPTPTPTPKIPGFEAVFAITGLIAVMLHIKSSSKRNRR